MYASVWTYISVYIYMCVLSICAYVFVYMYECMCVLAWSGTCVFCCSVNRDSPNINRTIQLDNQPRGKAITNTVRERCRMGRTTENRILSVKEEDDRRKLFQSTDMTACLIKKLYCKNINIYLLYCNCGNKYFIKKINN